MVRELCRDSEDMHHKMFFSASSPRKLDGWWECGGDLGGRVARQEKRTGYWEGEVDEKILRSKE